MSTIVGTNIEVTNIKYDSDTTAMIVSSTGGGAAHNNLQPYIVVYMWRRTA